MLVIKSLLEPASSQMSDHASLVYWDGKSWGKGGLAWAATYKAIDDLPAKLGSATLDCNADPLTYVTKEGIAIAMVERITPKEDVPQGAPCYYIHVDLHVSTTRNKIILLAQANHALPKLTEGCDILASHIEVKPDLEGKVKPSSEKPSSITTTPLVLEPEPSPLEQALQTATKPKK